MDEPAPSPPQADPQVERFLQHLAIDRGASAYTQRNYSHALREFAAWHATERHQPPPWHALQRDDFRAYLRFLGRQNLGRSAVHLRFCALRTFYKFLIRHGVVESSPIKNISLPKMARRLPRFLTQPSAPCDFSHAFPTAPRRDATAVGQIRPRAPLRGNP